MRRLAMKMLTLALVVLLGGCATYTAVLYGTGSASSDPPQDKEGCPQYRSQQQSDADPDYYFVGVPRETGERPLTLGAGRRDGRLIGRRGN